MMNQNQAKKLIASRVARELKNGDVVNLGIGIPTMVPGYLPVGVEVILHSENGILGTGPTPSKEQAEPAYVVDAGGKPASIATCGAYIDSVTSFGIIRGGHVDVTVLGALEVDQYGNLSNWIIPGKKVPGMGGAMDLVVGAKKVVIAMEHTARGVHKILAKCSLPYTALNCVDLIITEMGVMQVMQDGLHLMEYNPEYTIDEIKAATGCPLIVSPELKPIQ